MSKTTYRSFFFWGDLIDSTEQLPLNLFDDFNLVNASEEQIKIIKLHIDRYHQIVAFAINKFERHYIESNKFGGGGYEILQSEEKDFRYFAIEHSQTQAIQNFALISSLVSIELTTLFEASYVSGITTADGKPVAGVSKPGLRALIYFHDDQLTYSKPIPIKSITKATVIEMKTIAALLKHFDVVKPEYPFIDKALTDYLKIKEISVESPFKILSHISVLELLLTSYRPRSASDNSLSNQLQKKINLLNNLFTEKIDIRNYFNGPDTLTIEIIMEKIYRYRNDIAHGNFSDFQNELQLIKGQVDKILLFLRELLRKVLIKSLEQPQLIRDLKEC